MAFQCIPLSPLPLPPNEGNLAQPCTVQTCVPPTAHSDVGRVPFEFSFRKMFLPHIGFCSQKTLQNPDSAQEAALWHVLGTASRLTCV